MWPRNSPSYNLPMHDLRPALGCAALLGLLVACGPVAATNQGGGGHGGAAGGGVGGAGAAAAGGVAAGEAGEPAGGAAASGGGGFAPVMPIGTDLGELSVESIAVWKGDAKGAYTIIHDDLCDWSLNSLFTIAEPELTKRGLRSAFGAIVKVCEERTLWRQLQLMRDHGHEIINHSWDHQDMVEAMPLPTLELELDHSTEVLDSNLKDQKTSFFIFPYDSINDAAVEHLGTLGYLGARAGKKGVNKPDFPDGMRVMFDVYGGENSIYDGMGDILQIYVDLAISEGGWSVREFHGVDDTSFWAMATPDYQAHLDYVKSKVDSGELWVDTPSTVVRYRFARQYCGVPQADGYQLAFAAPSTDCARYATPLTVLISTELDAPSLLATQDGQMLTTRKLAERKFAVDIDPSLGPAAVGGGD